jgi:outer membrane protein assembly factor BamC
MRIARLGVLATCAALAACSVLEGDKIDYKSATKGATLEVPPDLTQLTRDSRYQVPGGASAPAATRSARSPPACRRPPRRRRAHRARRQPALAGGQPPGRPAVGPVRDFWQESGFLLVQDQPNLGIMETDWAENRAKIPQDFIRNTLGKLFDSLYSTAERDRFRTRLERTPTGGTEIYISHRGMQEVYTNNAEDQTVWQPRPTDPELEAEFLRRLMVKLGVPQEQSKAPGGLGRRSSPHLARAPVQNTPVVQIDEGFDRAWRRVGLALDRTGFTVEDRDRSQGTYFVRYVPPNPTRRSRASSPSCSAAREGEAPLKYRITLKSQGESTTVSVLERPGRAGGLGQRAAHRAGDRRRPEVKGRLMIRFKSLGSGSTGNATVVQARGEGRITHLLVDCGLGIRELDKRLGQAGMLAEQIDAIFITHEHADHIGCARQAGDARAHPGLHERRHLAGLRPARLRRPAAHHLRLGQHRDRRPAGAALHRAARRARAAAADLHRRRP